VRGINLKDDDYVIEASIVWDDNKYVFIATEK